MLTKDLKKNINESLIINIKEGNARQKIITYLFQMSRNETIRY